ncbi:hypothetical protein FG93_01099 [Bosea sp. LC85]|uniref:hypothetical protein n=1 Tax=Bosea sp. LC85 TaxID=1502851 RepID=UPI0004E2A955|nr:hypothetical protein [Bosea sp. LC85]KFC74513.1 hypothetical protein FG93_01099 [Bosea sp. LC85]
MSQTKADLVREVLGELFSLASGQTPNADDAAWVEQRIEPALALLARKNVIYLADAEAIADEAFDPLVTYLAQVCGPKFGRPRDFAARQAAEDELRLVQRIGTGTGALLTVDPGLRRRRPRSLTGEF